MKRWTAVISGAVTFLAPHAILVRAWPAWSGGANEFAPWFMNSGRGIVLAAVAFFAVGAICGATLSDPQPESAAATGGYISLGAVPVMIVVLFRIPGGPGTLFPIAIVLGALLIGGMSLFGAAAGAFGRMLFAERR